jgi:hypothetical protein
MPRSVDKLLYRVRSQSRVPDYDSYSINTTIAALCGRNAHYPTWEQLYVTFKNRDLKIRSANTRIEEQGYEWDLYFVRARGDITSLLLPAMADRGLASEIEIPKGTGLGSFWYINAAINPR